MTTTVLRTCAKADRWSAPFAFFRRLHFYVGLFVAPFLLVSAITGVMYTVAPSLTETLHRHELAVDSVGPTRLPLSEQVRAAQGAQPGRTITAVWPAPGPQATSKVVFDGAGCPCTVFVDPYTGQAKGTAKSDGNQLFEAQWTDELHRTLLLGKFGLGDLGRDYAELSASWLWVLALTGPVLWWFGRKKAGGADRRGRSRSWHARVGLILAPGLLFLSASGLSWSLHAGERIDELRSALSGANPSLPTRLGHPAPAPAQDQREWLAQVDRVDAAARTAGLVDPVLITVPSGSGSAWTASDRHRSWPFRYDRASVDPESGAVLAVSRFSDWPVLAKVTQWAIALHMGLLFGWANALVLALVGIGLVVVIVLGYRMWWLRRPTKGLPAMPRRGALADLSPGLATALVGAMVFVGWFLPVFGVSLVGFVAVDVLLGRRRARLNN